MTQVKARQAQMSKFLEEKVNAVWSTIQLQRLRIEAKLKKLHQVSFLVTTYAQLYIAYICC